MKRTINILILTIFTIISCNKSGDCNPTILPYPNDKISNLFTIDSISNIPIDKYDKNLDILRKGSYFDLNKKEVYIETPVPNKNFKVVNAYFFKEPWFTGVLIHVTDKTGNFARTQAKHRFLIGKIPFKEFINIESSGGQFNPSIGETILVVLYNDDGTISFKEAFKPKESGGGVIIGGP